MAPEVVEMGRQTPKADIWSLFVTLFWVHDFDGFQRLEHRLKCSNEISEAFAVSMNNYERVSGIKGMREKAVIDPEQGASAAQVLVKHFQG